MSTFAGLSSTTTHLVALNSGQPRWFSTRKTFIYLLPVFVGIINHTCRQARCGYIIYCVLFVSLFCVCLYGNGFLRRG